MNTPQQMEHGYVHSISAPQAIGLPVGQFIFPMRTVLTPQLPVHICYKTAERVSYEQDDSTFFLSGRLNFSTLALATIMWTETIHGNLTMCDRAVALGCGFSRIFTSS